MKIITKLQILVVDDHALMRKGLSDFLYTLDFVKRIDEAESGLVAIEKVMQINPEFVIMDLSMPEMNGLDVTAAIKRLIPDIKVAIYTVSDEWQHVEEAFQAGADGYILKASDPNDLQVAIIQIMDGKCFISEEVLVKCHGSTPKAATKPNHALSPRQLEIIKLLCDGNSAKQIAGKLFLSEATVNNHRANIMKKLKVGNTAALVSWAHKFKIIP